VLRRNKAREWSWRLEAGNYKKVAWSGQTYKTKQGCENGLRSFLDGCETAPVFDYSVDPPVELGTARVLYPRKPAGV
jgi:uncharacterized protein YegP (UPF0339 family)